MTGDESLCDVCAMFGAPCNTCSDGNYLLIDGSCTSSEPGCPTNNYVSAPATTTSIVGCTSCPCWCLGVPCRSCSAGNDSLCATCLSPGNTCMECIAGSFLLDNDSCTDVLPACPATFYVFDNATETAKVVCQPCMFHARALHT